jgi:hypothetical protein
VVAVVAQVIRAPAETVRAHTVKLMLDTMAKQEHHIQPMVAAEVVAVVGTMVAPAVEVMEAHTVVGRVPAIPAAKQEIQGPVGVIVTQMVLLPMVELLAGNRVSLFQIM